MSGLLLAAVLAAAQLPPAAAAAPADELPYSVRFARTRIGPWKMAAETIVERSGGLPLIDFTQCRIERAGLELTMWAEGGLWFTLNGGNADTDLHFGADDIRHIAFDGEVREMRWIETSALAQRFVDVAYAPLPPPEPCYMCARASSGYWTSRRRAGDPHLSPQLLAGRLVRARMLRIGFQAEVDEGAAPGPILWAEIPLAGLDAAFAWCRQAMASDRAQLFHAEVGG